MPDEQRTKTESLVEDAHVRMALDAAGMVTWEWDIPSGSIRYSDNAPSIAAGEAMEPYCTLDGLLQQLHPNDREALAKALERTLAESCPFECEYRVLMQDGRYRWILGKGTIVVVEGGKPVRVLGISQDVTERKQADEELRRRSRQLAELASELTVTEHRARRLLAERLHDHLQQLLVGARMQAQALLIRQGEDTRPQMESLVDALTESLDSARAITRDLAPPVPLQKDFVGAMRWLAWDMQHRHQLAVTLQTVEVPESLPEAATVLLYTAARELLFNVVKHAGSCQAALRLSHAGGALVLEVRDTGAGFDTEAAQAAAGRQGFGLSSIRERAELLGGRLRLESVPGLGTRAVLELPCAAVAAKEGQRE